MPDESFAATISWLSGTGRPRHSSFSAWYVHPQAGQVSVLSMACPHARQLSNSKSGSTSPSVPLWACARPMISRAGATSDYATRIRGAVDQPRGYSLKSLASPIRCGTSSERAFDRPFRSHQKYEHGALDTRRSMESNRWQVARVQARHPAWGQGRLCLPTTCWHACLMRPTSSLGTTRSAKWRRLYSSSLGVNWSSFVLDAPDEPFAATIY